MNEKTLVIIKPDGVKKKIVGEIITRFEKVGLTISRMKMMVASEELARKHYNKDDVWCKKVGKKTISEFKEKGYDVVKTLGSDDPLTIGKQILNNLIKYITRGKVIVMVLEGPYAIDTVRKIVGSTYPLTANPGTIRGDYAIDTAFLSAYENRSVENIVHASENGDDAKREIELWFGEY